MNGRKLKIAFFAGLSAFIGTIENFIPLPVPFLRLGISNIPVVLSFSLFNFQECFFILMFKVIFSHLFRGTIFSYVFLIGLSGNLIFFLISYPFYRLFKKHISFISLSIISAFLHNAGQIAASSFFVPINVLFLIGTIFCIIGVVTGLINGIICNIINNKIFIRFFIEEKKLIN